MVPPQPRAPPPPTPGVLVARGVATPAAAAAFLMPELKSHLAHPYGEAPQRGIGAGHVGQPRVLEQPLVDR